MVVYEDYSTGHGQVYGYKISTNGPPAPLAPLAAGTAADQLTPDIDGNTVVWVEHQAGSDQIFALDLVTNVVTQLTTSPSNKVQPRISGNRVVWADDRNGNLDLYMYDLSTHLGEQPLVTGPGDQFLADIDGDRVVYTDNSAGFEQVFEFVFAHGPSPYNFTGFFQPVDNLPTINAVKAGSAVPVKFSLGGNQGLDIFAAGYPASQQIVCSTSAPTDQIEQTVTAGSSGLSYDATTDQYSYVWKTDKSWVGTCGQLTLMLKDGTSHTANFEFTK